MKLAISSLVKARLMGSFLLLLVVGLFLAALDDIITLVDQFSTKSPLIAADHYMSLLLILPPGLLPVALLFTFGKPAAQPMFRKRQTRTQKLKSDQQSKWAQRYVIYLFASVLAALFAPIPQFFIINYIATERGYTYCPTSLFSRREPDHWALPGPHGETERCPREGTITTKP